MNVKKGISGHQSGEGRTDWDLLSSVSHKLQDTKDIAADIPITHYVHHIHYIHYIHHYAVLPVYVPQLVIQSQLGQVKQQVNKMALSITTLDDLIAQLHKAFEGDVVDVDYVTDLFNAYKSNPIEWKTFAKFDRYRYTRNLVDEGNGKFNLMLLCWGEGHVSSVHDHADSHCFMKMLDGALREVRFSWPEESADSTSSSAAGGGGGDIREMQPIGEAVLETNEVCYINDSLGLHRVENPSHVDRSVSLHLYSPPFESCQMFDQRTGKKTPCKVTFWSKFGERLPTGAANKSNATLPESCKRC